MELSEWRNTKHVAMDMYAALSILVGPRVPDWFFDTTCRIFELRPSRREGGVSDTVPSAKSHLKFYMKLKTGDGREFSPPVLYKTEHRGR